jgi:uncharacterized protein
MPRKDGAFVLDSWAVIAYLEDEPAGEKIADLIASAHEDGIPIYMCVVNLGEVWYIIAREISEKEAENSIKELLELRIQPIVADWELTREAAQIKSQQKMSYADCFAAALARTKQAELVTGDSEFKRVEGQIKIKWV